MNIKAFIEKLKPAAAADTSLYAVIQPDAIYFSQLGEIQLESVKLENGNWQSLLFDELKKHHVSGVTLNIVLNSNLYQTYQLDTPNLPQEEWSVGLPFLLKDLVTEKVTEIVADAFHLPGNNKIQAHVVKKALVLELVQGLSAMSCKLGSILVEDDVWGNAGETPQSFLLLQRSRQGSYKISAYQDGRSVFHRTIRNVTAPLTGVASSVLQLDGMALELQRSVDYLSSQLKGAPLHILKVCCDDEEQSELVQALDERLNVKVTPLIEEPLLSGEILAAATLDLPDGNINLYPSHLRPKKDYFTFQNVAACWGISATLLLVTSFYFQYQSSQLSSELKVYQSQASELSGEKAKLQKELGAHLPSPDKVAAIARLKLEIQAKQDSLQAIGDYDRSLQQGYSGVMSSLAKLGREDISLSKIYIGGNQLDLQGLARDAKTVPNWINQFKRELDLVGRTFEKLKIGRNESDVVTFELSTRGDVNR
ncbi:MSHA biogenesis protein MshI [Vibrio paucivorans]|uniref:MSHA biogenesis protein MshI n=1 Tax=Vibrio paucivorans TaxID=2829489 RepID=A0A9X3CB66_9VIBR|nr:MSHA biogenesis protein MshI [Vibrio paucivorans]MCW8332448.1 MSHA biogenesis protein MshI [Vibrio paucivorans]